jgi:hypothetical protein
MAKDHTILPSSGPNWGGHAGAAGLGEAARVGSAATKVRVGEFVQAGTGSSRRSRAMSPSAEHRVVCTGWAEYAVLNESGLTPLRWDPMYPQSARGLQLILRMEGYPKADKCSTTSVCSDSLEWLHISLVPPSVSWEISSEPGSLLLLARTINANG